MFRGFINIYLLGTIGSMAKTKHEDKLKIINVATIDSE